MIYIVKRNFKFITETHLKKGRVSLISEALFKLVNNCHDETKSADESDFLVPFVPFLEKWYKVV